MALSGLFRNRQDAATLTAIYISVSAGEPMQSTNSITAIAGKGLDGDRYAEQKGFYRSVDSCEVTLITQEEIDRTSKRASTEIQQMIANGGHRRAPSRFDRNEDFRGGGILIPAVKTGSRHRC